VSKTQSGFIQTSVFGAYFLIAICFILPLIGFIAPTVYGFLYPRLLEKSARAV
jgi:hypothetical protein